MSKHEGKLAGNGTDLLACRAYYVDKQYSGFITWAPETKAYAPVPAGDPPITWEPASRVALDAIGEVVSQAEYFDKLMALWGQESSRNTTTPDLRTDNVAFIKSIGNKFQLRAVLVLT
jgi:proteasome activator subunit 4